MNNKNIQPWAKTALEMGPVILFFVVYSKIKDNEYLLLGETYEGFIVATALFIPILLIGTILITNIITRKIATLRPCINCVRWIHEMSVAFNVGILVENKDGPAQI